MSTPITPGETVRQAPVQPSVRLLFVVNSDWFFLSHRLALATRAKKEGYEVHVAAVETGRGEEICRHGFTFHALRLSRDGMHPVRELASVLHLVRLYRAIRPDLVHHITPKPVLYGSLAARAVQGIRVVNAVTGLGYLFASAGRREGVRRLVLRMYRAALSHPASLAIFQNRDDRDEFLRLGLVRPERAALIRGSGVNCHEFRPRPVPYGTPVVMFLARMLWDKGVGEFVEAARIARERKINARWVLVGGPDEGNPASIPEARIRRWMDEGIVEWWGHTTEVPEVLASASIVVLPSYREGLPKSLLEAAACARPIITTDVPGCREIVRHGVNGFLVPPRESIAITDRVAELLADPELRASFGAASREIAETEFDDRFVVGATVEVYRRMLEESGRTEPEGAAASLGVRGSDPIRPEVAVFTFRR